MSYPTPMDIAQAEDRDADLSPSERLANICAALDMEQSETRLAALATRCKEHEQFRHQHRNCDRLALENRKLKALLREVLAADKYDWNMGLEDRIKEALLRRSKNK